MAELTETEEGTRQAQKGFIYERNVFDALSKPIFNIIPDGFSPAGASSNQPDLKIQKMMKTNPPRVEKSGVELKISAASAGSLKIEYNPDARQGSRWSVGKAGELSKEKKFIQSVAAREKIAQKLNAKPEDGGWRTNKTPFAYMARKDKRSVPPIERYYQDMKMYQSITGTMDARYIERYYNLKDTYYINIGTRGFYLLGTKNPLNINRARSAKGSYEPIIPFSSVAQTSWRARVQKKTEAGGYQFTLEFVFTIPAYSRSPLNIGPIRSDGKTVDIYNIRAQADNLQSIFGMGR